jgi:hypothetical protein
MLEKIKEAQKRLQFSEKAHRYKLDGKPIKGTTTFLGSIAKPALINWAANEAVDYIKAGASYEDLIGYVITDDQLFELARKAHRMKRDKAADLGTLTHKWVEAWINGENPESDPEYNHMTDNFVAWALENEIEFLAAEQLVFSEKHWYAGQLDFLFKMRGKTYLGDLKTSSGIYENMFYQTSAYQMALQEMDPDFHIDGHAIINCKKDGKFAKKFSFDFEKNVPVVIGARAVHEREAEIERNNPWKKRKK